VAPRPTQLALGSSVMRVGIVCPYALDEPGGVQQVCHELSVRLRSSGVETVLVGAGSIRRAGGPGWSADTMPLGRTFKVRANRSTVPLTADPRSWRRLARALEDVDVVHVHEPLMPLLGWAALRSRQPMVATFHADAPNWARTAYRVAPIVGRRMRRAVLTAVSSTARRSVPQSWGDVRIIPNGINVDAYDVPTGRVARRIAFLGRDEPRKGLDIALDAFSRVRSNHPDAELMVMGADRGAEIDGVRFLGRVSEGEKHRTLKSSAIYLAPNTGGESFGIVAAEAMAAGCAIVASDLVAFREVLGDAGVFIPVGDAAALAREVSGLLEDVDRRDALGARAQAAVHKFDWSVVVDEYRQAYAAAISNR